ncbi:hypothetical protein [Pseudanabaena sp. 'Roaring Creek']|uniref:hypothetical protein n=1 Tax=Pseudanabaena sp. 'Roaring Creek' TaxID=1681830 RepID=UPI000A6D05A2|nr:hypothetical protein [Pseudanabaena sp. 'Roaring Creek']
MNKETEKKDLKDFELEDFDCEEFLSCDIDRLQSDWESIFREFEEIENSLPNL